MTNSRSKLKKFVGKRQYFTATVGELTHKMLKTKDIQRPVVLLLDVHIASKTGKNLNNVSDHMWVNLSNSLMSVGTELFPKDRIIFSAKVSTYNILRDDTVNARQNTYQNALDENERLYRKYSEKKQHWINLYSKILDDNENVYDLYSLGRISYDRMRSIQTKNIDEYNRSKPDVDKLKRQQKKNIESAKKKQKKISLVDYQLVDIRSVKLLDQKRLYYGWTREKYDPERIYDVGYTKYLAARSFAYNNKVKYSEFTKEGD